MVLENFPDFHLAEISLMTYDQVVEISTDRHHLHTLLDQPSYVNEAGLLPLKHEILLQGVVPGTAGILPSL